MEYVSNNNIRPNTEESAKYALMSDVYAVGVQLRSGTDIGIKNRLGHSKRTWRIHTGSGPGERSYGKRT